MEVASASLATVYDGWQGYNTSIIHAIEPLTAEQLAFRPAPGLRSVAELARHIACGRITWFLRMPAPGSQELAARVPEWSVDSHGNRYIVEERFSLELPALVEWLQATWTMVHRTLNEWTVEDLRRTYRHTFRGTTYAVSYQWTIWRIMAHDIQHGGQLSMLLYLQGIEPFELGGLGGHLVEPPLAEIGTAA